MLYSSSAVGIEYAFLAEYNLLKITYHSLFSRSRPGAPGTWCPLVLSLISFSFEEWILTLRNWWQINSVSLSLMWSDLKFSGQRNIAGFCAWAPKVKWRNPAVSVHIDWPSSGFSLDLIKAFKCKPYLATMSGTKHSLQNWNFQCFSFNSAAMFCFPVGKTSSIFHFRQNLSERKHDGLLNWAECFKFRSDCLSWCSSSWKLKLWGK